MPDDSGAAKRLDEIRALADERMAADNDAAGDTIDIEWPPDFFVSKGAIWYQPRPTTREAEPSPIWVCAALRPIAETRDENGGSWGLLLRWDDRDDRLHEWAMPRRLLHLDGNQIAAELDHAGLTVGTSQQAHERLKQFLGWIKVSQHLRCVTRTGWHQTEAGHVYVLPGGETFGPRGARVILQSEHIAAADATRPRGTLAEWQEQVARYAVGNHRLGLYLSAAFAPPLLDVANEPSGGLHLHGGSQTGKTTVLYCGASVWGRADTSGQIRTWRATGNGMEGVAAETCDALLPLDEIGMVDAREAGEIVYSLANESGKARAGRDGSARARRTWRTVFLSTGEVPLSVKMGERGAAPMAGQEVRLANIPADAGAGLGVFQKLHGKADGTALAVHLREATRSYYGTAARAFLDKLAHERATDPKGLTETIEKVRRDFLDKRLPAGADGQVVSVARRFSLLAAAGELARMFGVLPWTKGEAMAAAAAGLTAWIKARGGTGAAEDAQAVATVRRFLEQHEESRFSLLLQTGQAETQAGEDEARSGRPTVNRVGYRRETTAGGWEFLIFPEVWKSEICKGIDPMRVAEALHSSTKATARTGRKSIAFQARDRPGSTP